MATEHLTDESLVAACLAGETTAWRHLFDRFHDRLCGYLCRTLHHDQRNRDVAEEVVASFWLRLWSNPSKLRVFDARRSPLGAFLCLLARHELWRHLRAQSCRPRFTALLMDVPEHHGCRDTSLLLAEFMASLPPRGRTFVESKVLNAPQPMQRLSASERKLKKRVEGQLRSFLGLQPTPTRPYLPRKPTHATASAIPASRPAILVLPLALASTRSLALSSA